jgi:hypothetical protein
LVTRSETRFASHDCVKLENTTLALWLTRSVGPRILGLALPGGENLFAVLPDDNPLAITEIKNGLCEPSSTNLGFR